MARPRIISERCTRVVGLHSLFLLIWLAPIFLIAVPGMAEERDRKPRADPIVVRVKTFLADVDDISSVDQNFTASLFLEFRWRDPELARAGSSGGTIASLPASYPRFKIVNSQRVWDTFDQRIEVARDGELTLRRRVWGQFSQPLDLKEFPFDRHTLQIQIAAVARPEQFRFIPNPEKPSGMAKQLSVADWHVSNYGVEEWLYAPIPGEYELPGLLISFDAERRGSHYVVKVIAPLVLIVAMSWVVFWIDPKETGSQIAVSVTTMLTLIAYRFAVGSELPNIPYLTRMDAFLLGSTVLVFSSLVEVVITSSLAGRDRLERARAIDRGARRVFPLVFLLLTLWAFAL